ncbi:hypothetical protein SDC9_194977 [bioreactor metagenome]|uniref:Uncharacterized protein n=1 Tax=bioreactor metagenome TaxID=1076179 RepID=A0A645I7R6_9ZZZZ
MEAVLGRYDTVSVRRIVVDAIFPDHFDHCFIGFSAGILIENLIHADSFTDPFGQYRLGNSIRIICGMNELLSLFANGLRYLFIAITAAIYSYPAKKIKPGITILVI